MNDTAPGSEPRTELPEDEATDSCRTDDDEDEGLSLPDPFQSSLSDSIVLLLWCDSESLRETILSASPAYDHPRPRA